MRQDLFDTVFVAHGRAAFRQALDSEGEGQVLGARQVGELRHHPLPQQFDVERLQAEFDLAGLGGVVVERGDENGL